MFKKILAIAAIFTATSANADGYASKTGIVVNVEPVYSTAYAPKVQEQCFEAQIPVYGQVQGSSGDALLGAVIGGAIGNQFGGGSGKDAMTVLGAIVGANEATKPSNRVVGYTTEWRCEMVKINQETKILHHYQVTYKLNGRYHRVNVDRPFEVGQSITIQ
jgi:uncharacterized protein YcfJ